MSYVQIQYCLARILWQKLICVTLQYITHNTTPSNFQSFDLTCFLEQTDAEAGHNPNSASGAFLLAYVSYC
ncbi:MAG: hypothetical protein AAFQ87_22945, partial [Bacteroidota bacterium]